MSVTDATQAELERLGVLDTTEAAVALNIARGLDSGTALMGLAANAKQLLTIMQTLRDSAPKAKDEVNELLAHSNKKRAARGSGASVVVRTTQRPNKLG
jgi:hypothetical protein